jgi:hypothetical protein
MRPSTAAQSMPLKVTVLFSGSHFRKTTWVLKQFRDAQSMYLHMYGNGSSGSIWCVVYVQALMYVDKKIKIRVTFDAWLNRPEYVLLDEYCGQFDQAYLSRTFL